MAAVVWELLQLVGGYYIGHIYRHSSNTYAQFALVIALMVWLHLGAQITVYAAEVNVVVARRLWPRNLLGPPDGAADEATLRALAQVEERSQGAARRRRISTDRRAARASEQRVGRVPPGHLQRPRAQPALGRAAVADRALRLVGDRELARQHAAGERGQPRLELGAARGGKDTVTGSSGRSRNRWATSTSVAPARSAASAYTSRWVP